MIGPDPVGWWKKEVAQEGEKVGYREVKPYKAICGAIYDWSWVGNDLK